MFLPERRRGTLPLRRPMRLVELEMRYISSSLYFQEYNEVHAICLPSPRLAAGSPAETAATSPAWRLPGGFAD